MATIPSKKQIHDLHKRVAAAISSAPDMRISDQTRSGVIEAGITPARFIGYYEMGQHESEYEGEKSVTDWVQMVFELSGPKHPPRNSGPVRVKLEEKLSLDERARFFKLFRSMNYDGGAKHMAELLGAPVLIEIFHRRSLDNKRTFATLKGPYDYNVQPAFEYDTRTGEKKLLDVAAPVSPLKAFFWDGATKEDWDSIYIAGEYAERKDEKTGEVIAPAKTKNVIQERIKEAVNWKEHPLYEYVSKQLP